MERDQALFDCWRQAAIEPGIKVEEVDGAVRVAEFGSKSGMLCAICETRGSQDELTREAKQRGMGWSALGTSYLTYDRELFVDTLNDWGWCASAAPPEWYSGEPWGT
jgi:hypothetical protein